MDETQDFLQRWVGQDLKTMTFRLLARERGINVDEAKTQLADFYSSNSSSCHPTWILTGTLLPPPSDAMDVDDHEASQDTREDEGGKAVRMGVLLCTEEDIEQKKTLFIAATLSQHVYSLASAILRDPSTLIAPSNLLRSHPKYFRPAIYGTSVSPSMASSSSTSSTSVVASKKVVVVPEVKGKGKEKEKDVVMATAPDKLKPKKMVAGTLDFSRNLSKEQKDEQKAGETEKKSTLKRKSSPTGGQSSKSTTVNVSKPAPPSPPPAAKSSLKAKPKSRVVLSEDEEEEEEVVAAKPKKKQMDQAQIDAELKGLEGMWEDADMEVDENGEDVEKVEEGKGKGKASTSGSSKRKEEIPASDSSDVEETAAPAAKPKKKVIPKKNVDAVDSEDEVGASTTSSSKAKKPAAKVKKEEMEEKRDEQGRLRKVRRVVKTVKGKNARGYEVEQDVSEQESYYTSDEDAPAPAPSKSKSKPKPSTSTSSTTATTNDEKKEKKALPKPKPAPSSKKPPTGQTSIGSFFSKK